MVADLWSRVPDVDPITYYWKDPTEARGPGDDEGAEEEPSPLHPRRRSLHKRSSPPPSAEEELSSVISFLLRLQSTVRDAEQPNGTPSAADSGSSILQSKRLTRTGVTPAHLQTGALPKNWSAPRIEVRPESVAEGTVPPRQESPAPPPPGPPARRPSRWTVLTSGLLLVTLGLAAYLWTRVDTLSRAEVAPGSTAPRANPLHAQETQPTAEVLKLVDLTLEAIQQGDLRKASDLLDKARHLGTGLPGLTYQAALLALSQGQPEVADSLLSESITAHESVAECWYLRANASFSAEGSAKAAEVFEQAIYADPFNARYYFFRAECLRRNGNLVAALAQFQQALRCRPSSADRELILLKIGMTRIESNTDPAFKTELRDLLSREPVAGNTLLLAAAEALSRNEYAEAAGDLKRAALALPPRMFQSQVRDYVFQSQAINPEIAAALKSSPPAGTAAQSARRGPKIPTDPATRSLAEADPAGW